MSQETTSEASTSDTRLTNAGRSRRRQSFLRWLCAVLVVLLLAGLAGVMSVDYLGRTAIEAAGTRALGVITRLDDLSIGVFSGKTTLHGLQVANPDGFKSSYLLQLKSGSLDLSLRNVLNETIEIEQLTLSGIHLNLVREGKEANYRAIMDHIQRLEDEAVDQKGADLAARKRFLVHSVIIRDVLVNVDLLPIGGKLTQLDVSIDLLELNEVGAESSQGENLARIIATVVRALLEAVLAKGENILPAETREELSDLLSEMKRAITESCG